MDFLEIRRKAKERAEAPARPPAEPSPASAAPGADASSPELDALAELRLTPLSPEPPPEPEPREPREVKPEEPLPPAPRWPGPSAEVALVEALREELAGKASSPVPAREAELEPAPRWVPAPAEDEPRSTPPPRAASPLPEPAAPVAPAGAPWSVPAPPEPVAAPSFAPPPAQAAPAAEPDPLDEFFFDAGERAPALADLAAAPAAGARPEAPDAGDARREYLTFLLGDEEYAVEIDRIHEVLKAPAITEVPRAPAHVLGVIMVRGEVIAVFDPRRRLGLPPPAAPIRNGRVLVCDAGDGSVGLLVDSVAQVIRLRAADVEPRPQGIGGVAADYIAGIGRDRDRLVVLLDLGAVLRGAAPKTEVRA